MHSRVDTFLLSCMMLGSILCTIFCRANQPVWDKRLDFHAIEERLRTEPVIDSIGIATFLKKTGKVVKGDNTIRLLTLASGLKAVFKPGEYSFAEVAAYKASKHMGLRLVPPTIMRIVDGVEGSVQFFVDSSIDLLKGDNRVHFLRKIYPKDRSDMTIFYFVFGQWDLHAGNQIVSISGGKPHLALIDNAGMLHKQHIQYGDFAFIQKGENPDVTSLHTPTFPFHKVVTLKPGPLSKLHALFSPFIAKRHIERIWERHKPITYVIWDNALWMQMYRYNPSVQPLKTKRYYASTLHALQRLDRDSLRNIWSNGMKTDQDYYEELIDLILERRGQVLKAAEEKGIIVSDL